MVKSANKKRGERESPVTRDDPPLKVIWFWIFLIAVSAFTIPFVWPSEGSGEYYPVGEYYMNSYGYTRKEIPNPNFGVLKTVTFLLAGLLGGAVTKLSLAALKMRDLSKLASFLAILGAALVAAFVLKVLPDPGAKYPLNDFPFILLFLISLISVTPGEALCVLLRWCYGKVAMIRHTLLLIGLWSLLTSATFAANRPNIILLLIDDQDQSRIGALGSDIDTPNLDRVAAEEVEFTHVYVSRTERTPSRYGFATGRFTGNSTR